MATVIVYFGQVMSPLIKCLTHPRIWAMNFLWGSLCNTSTACGIEHTPYGRNCPGGIFSADICHFFSTLTTDFRALFALQHMFQLVALVNHVCRTRENQVLHPPPRVKFPKTSSKYGYLKLPEYWSFHPLSPIFGFLFLLSFFYLTFD